MNSDILVFESLIIILAFNVINVTKMSPLSKGVATLLGFTLGISGAAVALTDGVLSLLVTVDKITTIENYSPSLSSEIALTFAIVTIILGFFLIRGSIWIWRFSVYGGALNLALGLVLVVACYGVLSFVPVQLTNDALAKYLLGSYVFASASSIISGLLGSIAHQHQLSRRFEQALSQASFKIIVLADNSRHEIEASASMTGGDIKEKVCEMEGLSKEDTRLLFEGKAVGNNTRLKDIGVGDGDQLTLITN